ncbi:MAG: hypothetical protein HRU01_02425 [Myxococcales bacterium]|nr:hypothetical protein [Myxococcales bacterium]
MTRSTALSNIGLLALAVLAIGIVGEVCFRGLIALGIITGPSGSVIFPDVPHMAKFVPSEDSLLHLELDPSDAEINRTGFRDREIPVERGDAVRIVALGDSVTFGRGVPRGQTWPKLLETSLNASASGPQRFEVLNMGVSGYNTRQEVRWYEKFGRAYAPDLIVLQYTLNDVFPAGAHLAFLAQEQQKTGARKPVPADGPAAATSRHDALPESLFLGFLVERTRELFAGRELVAPGWTVFYDRPNSWNSVRRSFQRLAAVTREDGTAVVLVVFPELVDFDAYPFASIHRKIAAEARRRGFPVLDLLPLFAEQDAESLRLTPLDSTHLNADALRLAAEAIEAFLVNTGATTRQTPRSGAAG